MYAKALIRQALQRGGARRGAHCAQVPREVAREARRRRVLHPGRGRAALRGNAVQVGIRLTLG